MLPMCCGKWCRVGGLKLQEADGNGSYVDFTALSANIVRKGEELELR